MTNEQAEIQQAAREYFDKYVADGTDHRYPFEVLAGFHISRSEEERKRQPSCSYCDHPEDCPGIGQPCTQQKAPDCQLDDEYPTFFRCVDAICPYCAGAVENHGPARFVKPWGWIHIWEKGDGHNPCSAARLWEILPDKLKEGRVL